jgi:hypothetical protein
MSNSRPHALQFLLPLFSFSIRRPGAPLRRFRNEPLTSYAHSAFEFAVAALTGHCPTGLAQRGGYFLNGHHAPQPRAALDSRRTHESHGRIGFPVPAPRHSALPSVATCCSTNGVSPLGFDAWPLAGSLNKQGRLPLKIGYLPKGRAEFPYKVRSDAPGVCTAGSTRPSVSESATDTIAVSYALTMRGSIRLATLLVAGFVITTGLSACGGAGMNSAKTVTETKLVTIPATGPAAAQTSSVPPTPTGAATSISHDGTYIVGTDVAPGTYKTAGPSNGMAFCTWKRLSDLHGNDMSSTIAIGNEPGQGFVTIEPSDVAFYTQFCQPW